MCLALSSLEPVAPVGFSEVQAVPVALKCQHMPRGAAVLLPRAVPAPRGDSTFSHCHLIILPLDWDKSRGALGPAELSQRCRGGVGGVREV